MKNIVLTFDDGPSRHFEELLDYLNSKKIKAVFFCLGEKLEIPERRRLVIKAIKKGHLIGNHSFSHANFNRVSLNVARYEVERTDNLIDEIYKEAKIKRKIKLFRFPHFLNGGILKRKKLRLILKELGYKNPYFKKKQGAAKSTGKFFHNLRAGHGSKYDVYCDIDPSDWDIDQSLEKIIKVVSKTKGGDIVDLHDHERTVKELIKPICEKLIEEKFRFKV